MSTKDDLNIAADLLADHGFDEVADLLRDEPAAMLGTRIAIYGPRYIWRGKLEGFSTMGLTLTDVYQIKDCEHDQDTPTDEVFFSKRQVFMFSAIANYGPVKWA